MFASKATSAKVSLKVTFKDDVPAGGLLFTFTSPDAAADRTTVQDTLIPYITANRQGPSMQDTVAATAAAGSGSPAVGSPAAANGNGNGTPDALNKGKRKAVYDPSTPTSDAGVAAGGSSNSKRPQMQNGKIKARVLRKNPNLKLLYTELVLAKEITEEEFWDGREVCTAFHTLRLPGHLSRHRGLTLMATINVGITSGGRTGIFPETWAGLASLGRPIRPRFRQEGADGSGRYRRGDQE